MPTKPALTCDNKRNGTARWCNTRRPLTHPSDNTGRQAVTKRTCAVEDCNDPSRKRGWCETHYGRWRKTGDPGDAVAHPRLRKKRSNRACSVEGCQEVHYAKGFCSSHYGFWKRNGDPNVVLKRRNEGACSVDGCERGSRAKGLCASHYQRLRHSGSTGGPEIKTFNPRSCSFAGCANRAQVYGLCGSHDRQRKKGRKLAPLTQQFSSSDRDEQGRKYCGTCQAWRHEDSYPVNTSRADGLSGQCKRCHSDGDLRRKYGITFDQYEAMLASQEHVCAVCGEANLNGNRLSVDHDHSCCPGVRTCGSCIRELLCQRCNMLLGVAKDSPSRLRAAAAYLERHEEGSS